MMVHLFKVEKKKTMTRSSAPLSINIDAFLVVVAYLAYRSLYLSQVGGESTDSR